MKKIIIALCLALACMLNAKAERNDDALELDSIAGLTNYFGIKIALTVESPPKVIANGSKVKCFTRSPGIEISGEYHRQFTRHLFIEPEIGLYYKRFYQLSDFYNRYMRSGHIDIVGMNMGFDVGLSKRYKECFFFVKTGPEVDLGLYGNETATFLKGWGEDVEQNAYKSLNRFNVLWNIGFGVSRRRFKMGADWGIGLTDYVSKYDICVRNKVFKLYVGFNF